MLRALAHRLDPLLRTRLGRYEQEHVATLRRLVRPGMVCWDVGANIGQMTYILSRLVGPRGCIVSIEPGPKNADTLRRLVGKRAMIVEAAVSEATGFARFAGDGRSDGGIREDGLLLVGVTTLDALLDRYPAPDLVKLDIEGHELPALRGATRLLRDVRPILDVEFHGAGLPDRDLDTECRAFVSSFGYHWTREAGGWHLGTPA